MSSSRYPTTSSTAHAAASSSVGGHNSNSQSHSLINRYPLQLWWFVASIIGLVTVLNVASLLLAHSRRRRAVRTRRLEDEGTKESGGAAYSEMRRSGLYHAVMKIRNASSIILYRRTIPLRLLGIGNRFNGTEILFSLAYLAATLAWCLVHSPSGAQNFANRAGMLAVSQTPLVVGLAGKNNVISFLTRVPPEKLQLLHRSSALTLLVLSLIHAFSEVTLGLNGHNAVYQPRIIYGVVGLVAFVLATLFASRFVRDRFYEFFLISHIVLIIVFLIFAALHMPQAQNYVFPAVGLWGLDRVARVFRLVFFNRVWRSFIPSRHPNISARGLVEPLSEDTLRLTIPRRMQWTAGQYAYVILPGISNIPFEAHPFTIASAATQEGENDLVFIVRVRDGCTKRLMRQATAATDARAEITVLVDGPYGCPPCLLQFSTVVLITGGSGVSYALAQLTSLIHQGRSSAVRRIVFIWVVRHASHIQWIAPTIAELLNGVPVQLEIQIRIWITQRGAASLPRLPSSAAPMISSCSSDTGASDVTEKATSHRGSVSSGFSSVAKSVSSGRLTANTTATEDVDILRFTQVRMHTGRPDIPSLLTDEIHGSLGPVSVDVCGPAGLAQEVRGTLAKWDVVGVGKDVELHVETFGW